MIDFSDAAVAALYLRGLPKRYEILVRTIEPKEDELTTANIKSKLILEDRRQLTLEQQNDKHVALKSMSRLNKSKDQNPNFRSPRKEIPVDETENSSGEKV